MVGYRINKDGDKFLKELHSILGRIVAIIYYSSRKALQFFFFLPLGFKIRTEVQKSEVPYLWSQIWIIVLATIDSKFPKFQFTISSI